jgi:hypothetical protein
VVGEFQLRYLVVDRVVTIEAPKDAWTVYESADFGYSMGHPVSWDVRHEPADADYDETDLYVGPVEGEVQVYLYTDLSDVMANQWFRESQAVLAEEYGTQPEVVSTFVLADGLEVQVLALEFTDGAEKYFFQQAVVFAGDVAWDLDWYSFVGSEEDDRARFLQFVNSFARATDRQE